MKFHHSYEAIIIKKLDMFDKKQQNMVAFFSIIILGDRVENISRFSFLS